MFGVKTEAQREDMLLNCTTRDKTRVTIHTEGDERIVVEGG